MKKIINSVEFQALEHALKVAGYVAASGFLATLVTELANNKTIANVMAKNPVDALVFMLVNMALAGAIKYVNLHKAAIEAVTVTPSQPVQPTEGAAQ